MKDINIPSTRHSRSVIYPKKRPSPHGICKARKSPSKSTGVYRLSPTKSLAQVRRQRDSQISALRRDRAVLEEEYLEEVELYMLEMEQITLCSIQSMDQQPEIKWHMRPCLVDFLVEIHFTFRLRPETLYLTLNIVDRYVSRRIVYIKHYQLVGCAALWIAAKFEETKDRVPTVQDLAQICRDTYEESAFIQMEGHVLSTIQWTLGHPTPEAWLRLMCRGPGFEDMKVQHIARFLMEITLFYREFVKYSPSAIAMGALTLARYLAGQGRRIFDETPESMEIVDFLDTRLAKHVDQLSETLVKKYSYAFYSKAATFVVHLYMEGVRFERQPLHYELVPTTPKRTFASSVVSTPSSSGTTSSSDYSDFPATPTSPSYPMDPFVTVYTPENDKENQSASFVPAVNKSRVDAAPELFLPHDFVTFGRSALQNLNIGSPCVVAL